MRFRRIMQHLRASPRRSVPVIVRLGPMVGMFMLTVIAGMLMIVFFISNRALNSLTQLDACPMLTEIHYTIFPHISPVPPLTPLKAW